MMRTTISNNETQKNISRKAPFAVCEVYARICKTFMELALNCMMNVGANVNQNLASYQWHTHSHIIEYHGLFVLFIACSCR